MESDNCSGCKCLDQANGKPKGNGYCCNVVRSKAYKAGDRVRYEYKLRCDLYEQGIFETRYEKERSK